MKTLLITGASTGIGRATAEYMAGKGWKVFAGVRKAADGAPLVAAQPSIVPLIIDVTKPDQIRAAVEAITPELEGRTLTALINNAGVANIGPLPLQPMDEVRAHFDINVLGLIEMTQNALPLLGMDQTRAGPPGRIINISSFGGRMPAPFLSAYIPFGIDAITLAPGAIKTPIWDKAKERDEKRPYANTVWADAIDTFTKGFLEAGENGWPVEKLAAMIEDILTSPSPKAYYAVGPDKFVNYTIASRLPKRMLDKGMARQYDIKRKDDEA